MKLGFLAEIILPVIIVFLMVSTLHGMTVSKTGYGALSELQERQSIVVEQVDDLRDQRIWMEHRAALLKSSNLDPDMVDERIRGVLGYASASDIVINRQDLQQAVAMLKANDAGQNRNGKTKQDPILETPVLDALALLDVEAGPGDPMAGIIAAALQ